MTPMRPLADYVKDYLAERPDSVILELEQVEAQAVNATVFYAGYADLREYLDRLAIDPLAVKTLVTISTSVSYSEWAIIRPLFLAYVERETAHYMEATRGFGVDVFGRSSSEAQQDINQLEAEMARRAFSFAVLTVGGEG